MASQQTVPFPIAMIRQAKRTSGLFIYAGTTLVLFACVTPYQPKGFTGGYANFETQPGVYYVSFQGTATRPEKR